MSAVKVSKGWFFPNYRHVIEIGFCQVCKVSNCATLWSSWLPRPLSSSGQLQMLQKRMQEIQWQAHAYKSVPLDFPTPPPKMLF